MSKVHEVKVVAVQTVAVVEGGGEQLSNSDIMKFIYDVVDIPRSAVDSVEFGGSVYAATPDGAGIIADADIVV